MRMYIENSSVSRKATAFITTKTKHTETIAIGCLIRALDFGNVKCSRVIQKRERLDQNNLDRFSFQGCPALSICNVFHICSHEHFWDRYRYLLIDSKSIVQWLSFKVLLFTSINFILHDTIEIKELNLHCKCTKSNC